MTRRPALIVDGYNVIHGIPAYSDIAGRDIEAARTRLVTDVSGFAYGVFRATVVFDGAGNPLSDGVPHRVAGVAVVFSPYGVSADTVVEGLVARAREAGGPVTVVTSDAAMQDAVLGPGVVRMSSREFATRVADDAAELASHAPAGSRRTRVEDRLDGSVRERLERWARGAD